MNSSSQASGQETLNYRLRPNNQGIRLDIWEEDPTCLPGQASYRFFMSYQLKSAEDANVILDQYLSANNVNRAVPSNDAAPPIHLRTLVGTNSVTL